jgi:hypothetical protein
MGAVLALTSSRVGGQWSLADLATHPGAVADWHRHVTENHGRGIRAEQRKVSRRIIHLTRQRPHQEQ